MPRKARIVEGAFALGLLLAGACASAPPTPPVPDGVDYIMAVQCAGLSRAVSAVERGRGETEPAWGRYERFMQWAEMRASESGQDVELARRDVTASWEDFRKAAGEGTDATRLQRLEAAYAGEIRACNSLSGVNDFVIVGG